MSKFFVFACLLGLTLARVVRRHDGRAHGQRVVDGKNDDLLEMDSQNDELFEMESPNYFLKRPHHFPTFPFNATLLNNSMLASWNLFNNTNGSFPYFGIFPHLEENNSNESQELGHLFDNGYQFERPNRKRNDSSVKGHHHHKRVHGIKKNRVFNGPRTSKKGVSKRRVFNRRISEESANRLPSFILNGTYFDYSLINQTGLDWFGKAKGEYPYVSSINNVNYQHPFLNSNGSLSSELGSSFSNNFYNNNNPSGSNNLLENILYASNLYGNIPSENNNVYGNNPYQNINPSGSYNPYGNNNAYGINLSGDSNPSGNNNGNNNPSGNNNGNNNPYENNSPSGFNKPFDYINPQFTQAFLSGNGSSGIGIYKKSVALPIKPNQSEFNDTSQSNETTVLSSIGATNKIVQSKPKASNEIDESNESENSNGIEDSNDIEDFSGIEDSNENEDSTGIEKSNEDSIETEDRTKSNKNKHYNNKSLNQIGETVKCHETDLDHQEKKDVEQNISCHKEHQPIRQATFEQDKPINGKNPIELKNENNETEHKHPKFEQNYPHKNEMFKINPQKIYQALVQLNVCELSHGNETVAVHQFLEGMKNFGLQKQRPDNQGTFGNEPHLWNHTNWFNHLNGSLPLNLNFHPLPLQNGSFAHYGSNSKNVTPNGSIFYNNSIFHSNSIFHNGSSFNISSIFHDGKFFHNGTSPFNPTCLPLRVLHAIIKHALQSNGSMPFSSFNNNGTNDTLRDFLERTRSKY